MSRFRNEESFIFLQLIHICGFSVIAWRKERSIEKNLQDFNPEELAPILRQFFVEARSLNGEHYSQNSMKAFRAGLDCFLTKAPHHKQFSLIRDKIFEVANDALDSHLKSLKKTGTITTKHEPPISKEDIGILYLKGQLENITPESLVQTAWLYTMFYFGRRGRENREEMTADDLIFGKTSSDMEYVTLRERETKTHAGGLRDNERARCPL